MGFIRPAASESWFEDEGPPEPADEDDQPDSQPLYLLPGDGQLGPDPVTSEPPNWWALTTRPSYYEWLDQD